MIFLTEDLWFPEANEAEDDGLLAVGGDLSPERLLLAYQNGIFPWFVEQGFLFWYCPPQRFVLYPEELYVSSSMKQIMRKGNFTITENRIFRKVIEYCASVHRFKSGSTWISEQFIESYTELHRSGYAKSIEVWEGDELVGGLYGIEVGNVFCGESMFSIKSNASKAALIHFSQTTKYEMIDCQVYSTHIESMGARLISRIDFIAFLKKASLHISAEK